MPNSRKRIKKRRQEKRSKKYKDEQKTDKIKKITKSTNNALLVAGTAAGGVFFENSINALIPGLLAPSAPVAACIICASTCALVVANKKNNKT